jgi:hypothetical protein
MLQLSLQYIPKNCNIKAVNIVKYNTNTYCNTPNFNPGNNNLCFDGLNVKQQNGNGEGVEEILEKFIIRIDSDVPKYTNKRLKNAKTLAA